MPMSLRSLILIMSYYWCFRLTTYKTPAYPKCSCLHYHQIKATGTHNTHSQVASLVRKMILFNVLLLTNKALNGYGPKYLKELLDLYQPTRCLCSAADNLRLTIPKPRLKTFGDRRFVTIFKCNLKTHVFTF